MHVIQTRSRTKCQQNSSPPDSSDPPTPTTTVPSDIPKSPTQISVQQDDSTDEMTDDDSGVEQSPIRSCPLDKLKELQILTPCADR